jgi:hypothetical protein
MTRILAELLTRNLDNERFVQLLSPFGAELDTLKKYDLKNKAGKYEMWGPTGMVQDFESVPIVKGSNKRGGAMHDIACRTDSDPVVTKAQAAEIYLEVMHHCNDIDEERFKKSNHPIIVPVTKTKDWAKRWGKWGVVRVWPGYFHKFPLLATCREIAGVDGDPYVTSSGAIGK